MLSLHRISSSLGNKMHKKSCSTQRDDVHVCIMCLRAIMNYQVEPQLLCYHCGAKNLKSYLFCETIYLLTRAFSPVLTWWWAIHTVWTRSHSVWTAGIPGERSVCVIWPTMCYASYLTPPMLLQNQSPCVGVAGCRVSCQRRTWHHSFGFWQL